MTNEERIEANLGMGYFLRKAELLCLAALHSGYYLRRQYRRFLGIESGKREQRLIDKLLAHGHARQPRPESRTQLVHLCSHPFYRRIGQPENRHRLRHSIAAAQVKLMGLDLVLAHPGRSFSPTEEEKLACICRRLGIDLSLLPRRVYRSPKGGASTTRYFVDKFPVFHPPSTISFVYVDAASVSCSGFETYLGQYFELIRALPSVRVFFATAEPHKIRWAKRRFRSLIRSDLPVDALLRFFRLEKLYRDQAFDRLPQKSLIELRNARRRIQGVPQVETLYKDWLVRGDSVLREQMAKRERKQVEFVPCPMEENYALFS